MRRSLGVVLGCIALSVACDNSGGGGSPLGSTTATLTTETFTGTVQPNSFDAHRFTVVQQGEVDVTLTSVGPPATIFMGLGVGTPGAIDGSCTVLATGFVNTQAGTTPQLVGSAAPGSFCVSVFDIGNQSVPVAYTVTVAHP